MVLVLKLNKYEQPECSDTEDEEYSEEDSEHDSEDDSEDDSDYNEESNV